MLDYDILAIFIGSNALLYLLTHIPLDILTFFSKNEKYKAEAKEYPAWDKSNFTKVITIVASLFFWVFFLIWPILHLLMWDNFILFFNFVIPYVTIYLQIFGMILVALGSLIAITGRFSRGTKAISWGVPKKLTINGMFRFIRHPLYSSYCFYFIGIPIMMLNFLLIPLILGIIGYYFGATFRKM